MHGNLGWEYKRCESRVKILWIGEYWYYTVPPIRLSQDSSNFNVWPVMVAVEQKFYSLPKSSSTLYDQDLVVEHFLTRKN